MSAHRPVHRAAVTPVHRGRPRERRGARRTFTAAVLALTSGIGFVAAAGPASAAGPWFVKPAAQGGNNAANCLSLATACATVTGVLGKAGFVSGDTINVAPGTYSDHPIIGAKGAKVVGTGAGVIFDGSGTTWALGVNSGANPPQSSTLTNLTLRNGGFLTGGGALPIVNGSVTATNVTVSDSKSAFGGGIEVFGSATLTMTGGAITNNTANAVNAASQGWGGGVYVAASGTLTLDGVAVSGNKAVGGTFATSGEGGGVMNLGATTIKNATFTDNRASGSGSNAGFGGGVYSLGGSLNLTDTSIAGAGTQNAVVGGGIASGTPFTATRVTLNANQALLAGGAYTLGATTFVDSTISGNAATNASVGFGGGAYAAGGSLTLDHTQVTGNTAAAVGGGIGTVASVTTEIRNGSSLTGNTAVTGGAVLNGGTATVRDSHVDGNSASFAAAGIYTTGALNVVNSSVDGNTAAVLGGGITTGSTGTSPNQVPAGSISVTGGHINDNVAQGAGGVFVGDGLSGSFDGTTFQNNTATNSGGGALFTSGVTAVARTSFLGNHAIHTTGTTGLGAAIYSGSNNDNVTTKLTVSSSTIAGNDAYAGSALITLSPGAGVTNKASIDNTTITGNTSSSTVGAIEQFHPLTITNSTVTDNSATGTPSNSAGALYMFAPASVGVAGTIFSGNTPTACTGAVADGGYNLAASGDTGCGFTPAKHDVTADPQLGALVDNGGPTKTRLPGPASPALDKVPASTATGLSDAVGGNAVSLCASGAQDQRGTGRPQGARCDLGSVEVVQVAPTVDGPGSADYTVGSAGTPVTFTTTGTPQATLAASGDIPAGISFHDNGDGTGTLSGTPGANTGGEHTITITGTNEAGSGQKTFVLKVHQAPLLSGPATDTYTVGQPGGPTTFSQTSGYPTGTLSSTGTLPGGVGFADHGDGTGSYSGTPAPGTGGVYDLTVKDSNGTPPDATAPFTLTVNEAAALDGPASATFIVGTAGSSAAFTASGFPVPTISGTGLPAGLGISGSGTAKITGTPANGTGGEYDATVTATNGVGSNATREVHVTVNEAPELTGPTEARFVAGSASSIGFSSDGYPVATVSLSGALPDGLTFHAFANGSATISGTAASNALGSYPVTITADNGVNPPAVIHLTIDVVPAVAIATTSLPNGAVGTAYSSFVAATGGQPPYSFSLESGSLPAGLTLHADGTITGTPTGPTGTSTFTVKVTDQDDPVQSDTQELSITIVKGATTLAVDPVVLQTSGLNLRIGIVKATLTGGFPAAPIAGQTVVFKAGATTVCTGTTGADGKVTCKMDVLPTLLVILNLGVSASYAGNALWEPSSGSAGLIG